MSRSTFRQRLGRRGERIAAAHLRAQGYQIEETNIQFPVGEIDILAREGATLCFVEVRSASSEQWGGPLASVTSPKQRRLIRAAAWYLNRLPQWPPQCRFDVIAIGWRGAEEPSVELIRGAFDAS
ncbi:MAG: YraN family protein [Candidatus Omnitrophica bacterium]|nr:YraN family protein [Candidatus Omnitrophota bacterium]